MALSVSNINADAKSFMKPSDKNFLSNSFFNISGVGELICETQPGHNNF